MGWSSLRFIKSGLYKNLNIPTMVAIEVLLNFRIFRVENKIFLTVKMTSKTHKI